jgi:uncharacterized sporulation protein YeaH/YhbH (DUF444 family)
MTKNVIIDKRNDPLGGSMGNRKRFLDRANKGIQQSLRRAFRDRSITDKSSDQNLMVKGGLRQPKIVYSTIGIWWDIYCGNDQFKRHDRITNPDQGYGSRDGSGISQGGEEDDYVFTASSDEFYNLILDGLELPKLKRVGEYVTKELKHAGLSPVGLPNNLDLPRTFAKALVRRTAMENALEVEMEGTTDPKIKEQLQEEIDNIPPYDDIDCVYRVRQQVKHRTRRAVMFCLMDVSGSMTEIHKHISKQFFLLLNRFLESKYDECEIVFIRYHSTAQECDEHTFFNSRETGGTCVSEAITLTTNLIEERYPKDKYNIYVALCSDGDTSAYWLSDQIKDDRVVVPKHVDEWSKYIRQFYYVDILNEDPNSNSDLYEILLPLESDTVTLTKIKEQGEVIPVFREIFAKQ